MRVLALMYVYTSASPAYPAVLSVRLLTNAVLSTSVRWNIDAGRKGRMSWASYKPILLVRIVVHGEQSDKGGAGGTLHRRLELTGTASTAGYPALWTARW